MVMEGNMKMVMKGKKNKWTDIRAGRETERLIVSGLQIETASNKQLSNREPANNSRNGANTDTSYIQEKHANNFAFELHKRYSASM